MIHAEMEFQSSSGPREPDVSARYPRREAARAVSILVRPSRAGRLLPGGDIKECADVSILVRPSRAGRLVLAFLPGGDIKVSILVRPSRAGRREIQVPHLAQWTGFNPRPALASRTSWARHEAERRAAVSILVRPSRAGRPGRVMKQSAGRRFQSSSGPREPDVLDAIG